MSGRTMNKRLLLITALFLLCITASHARGNSEGNPQEQEAEPRLVQVTGIVRLVGTGLFNDIVITREKTQWYVTQEEMYKLHDLQHQKVTVEAEETIVELRFANGISAGSRRILNNVRIIKVE